MAGRSRVGSDVVLLLLVRVGVAALSVDDGRVRVSRVVSSFGFVCEVGT